MDAKQFEEAAEIWYQRAKKLSAYYRDENKDILKRAKAYILYTEMELRVLFCLNIYTKSRIVKQRTPPFEKGGII